VRPTLEVIVTEAPAHLRREHDPATGLALIDLRASRRASARRRTSRPRGARARRGSGG
jgi:hypothetical protein